MHVCKIVDMMARLFTILTFLLLSTTSHAALTNVCFSPSNCCENNIVELINKSNETIDIAIYSFTNEKIYESLLNAKNRGIAIRIVADKTQSKGRSSLIPKLQEQGFDIRIKKKVKIEHNKFGVFDKNMIITGSYNWTTAATKSNSENCMLDKRKTRVSSYDKRFNELWDMYEDDKIETTSQEQTPRQE
jgi:phosphatidylserine/phosphatidylglycerophosphate/cardiolipin synthase-like enzyme